LPFAGFDIFGNAAKGKRKSDAPQIMGVIAHDHLERMKRMDSAL
jgi:hypothetical protein